MVAWLQNADLRRSQDGSSRRSVRTASSSSRLSSTPSPLNVLQFICSKAKFFVNLKILKISTVKKSLMSHSYS